MYRLYFYDGQDLKRVRGGIYHADTEYIDKLLFEAIPYLKKFSLYRDVQFVICKDGASIKYRWKIIKIID